MSEQFTEKEKHLVARYLSNKRLSRFDIIMHYAMYIAPSLAFAVYGFITRDRVAQLIGYLTLAFFVVWYLGRQCGYSDVFHSVMEKYEQRVGVLRSAREPGPAAVAAPEQTGPRG